MRARAAAPATWPGSWPPTGASTTGSTRSPAAVPSARLIDLLWDSTEAYRALYYGLPGEAAAADRAHRAIIAAVAAGDADAVVACRTPTASGRSSDCAAPSGARRTASPRQVPRMG